MNKYVQYTSTVGKAVTEGVCHKSRLEFLAVDDAVVSFTPIDDDSYAKLVEGWGGVETAPAKKPVEPKPGKK